MDEIDKEKDPDEDFHRIDIRFTTTLDAIKKLLPNWKELG